MMFENLRIRAMDGSALVEGRLTLQSGSPFARFLPSARPGDLIGVQLWNSGIQCSQIHLYKKWQQADDGLFAAAAPAVSIEFGAVMPNLQRLASRLWGQKRYKMLLQGPLTKPGTHMMTVSFRTVGNEAASTVYCHLEEVELKVERSDAGISIKLHGPLLPFAIEKDGPLIEDASINCDVVIPPAYCALAVIGSFGNYTHHADWHSGGAGLASIPLCPSALGPGVVNWGQKSSSRQCEGPYVRAYLGEETLSIRPSRGIWLSPDGMSHATIDSDGPEVQLQFGRSLLASLLESRDEAEVTFRTGIGYIDGQTGRSVGESGGPMRQDIRCLDLKLVRIPSELFIRGNGELEPLSPKIASANGSLGPQLNFSFSLKRTWLLARGIRLPRFWDDWKRDLGTTEVW